jgi:hypothetical protein
MIDANEIARLREEHPGCEYGCETDLMLDIIEKQAKAIAAVRAHCDWLERDEPLPPNSFDWVIQTAKHDAFIEIEKILDGEPGCRSESSHKGAVKEKRPPSV